MRVPYIIPVAKQTGIHSDFSKPINHSNNNATIMVVQTRMFFMYPTFQNVIPEARGARYPGSTPIGCWENKIRTRLLMIAVIGLVGCGGGAPQTQAPVVEGKQKPPEQVVEQEEKTAEQKLPVQIPKPPEDKRFEGVKLTEVEIRDVVENAALEKARETDKTTLMNALRGPQADKVAAEIQSIQDSDAKNRVLRLMRNTPRSKAMVRLLLENEWGGNELTAEDTPTVRRILEDIEENEKVRTEAAKVLGEKGTSGVDWQALNLVARNEKELHNVRAYAIAAIGKQGEEKDIVWLAPLTSHTSKWMLYGFARPALQGIIVRKGVSAISELNAVLEQNKSDKDLIHTLLNYVLWQSYFGYENAITGQETKFAIISTLWTYRDQAQDTLRKIKVGWSAESENWFTAPQWEVRAFGTRAFGDVGLDDTKRRDQVIQMVNDDDIRVRQEAVKALRWRTEPEVWVALKMQHWREKEAKDSNLAETINGILSRITEILARDIAESKEGAQKAIWDAISRIPEGQGRHIFTLLGEIGNEKDISKLVSYFDSKGFMQAEESKAAVQKILERINLQKSEVIEVLLKCLNDDAVSVRMMAIDVLQKIARVQNHLEIFEALSVVAEKASEDSDVKKAASESVVALKELKMYQEAAKAPETKPIDVNAQDGIRQAVTQLVDGSVAKETRQKTLRALLDLHKKASETGLSIMDALGDAKLGEKELDGGIESVVLNLIDQISSIETIVSKVADGDKGAEKEFLAHLRIEYIGKKYANVAMNVLPVVEEFLNDEGRESEKKRTLHQVLGRYTPRTVAITRLFIRFATPDDKEVLWEIVQDGDFSGDERKRVLVTTIGGRFGDGSDIPTIVKFLTDPVITSPFAREAIERIAKRIGPDVVIQTLEGLRKENNDEAIIKEIDIVIANLSKIQEKSSDENK